MLVAAGVLLSGCDDNKAPQSAATPQGQAEAPAPSAEQVEIEKYNAYVDAANSGGDFAAILEHRLTEYSKQLKSQNKLTEYYLFNVHDISNVRDNLKKALALPAPMPELDEPAKAMLVALEKLAPIHADLANYTESNGWLADDGKKAKEMEPALDAALEAVAVEQAKFYDGLSKRDEINVKQAFEAADKDSLAYYNAGFVLYGKQAMRLSREFFKSAGAEATIQPFADSLDKTAQMVEGWQKKNTSKSPSCTVLPSRMNQFVAKGRQAISTAKAGGYKYDEQRQMAWKNDNPIQRDAKFFSEAFDNVIRDMNSSQCD